MGYIDGEIVVNPTFEQLAVSKLDLTIAGSRDAVIMIEAGAKEVSEEVVLEALRIGQETNVKVIELQDKLVGEAGKPKTEVIVADQPDPALVSKVDAAVRSALESVIDRGQGRGERNEHVKAGRAGRHRQVRRRVRLQDRRQGL